MLVACRCRPEQEGLELPATTTYQFSPGMLFQMCAVFLSDSKGLLPAAYLYAR